jgi:hypothetical protein
MTKRLFLTVALACSMVFTAAPADAGFRGLSGLSRIGKAGKVGKAARAGGKAARAGGNTAKAARGAKAGKQKGLPPLRRSHAREFQGRPRVKTLKAGTKLYRSGNAKGRWYGTRATKTRKGTESMYKIKKWHKSKKYPNGRLPTSQRTFTLKKDTKVWYGKVKGGTGYQAYIPKGTNPTRVLKKGAKFKLK